jgi:hypothetical protein
VSGSAGERRTQRGLQVQVVELAPGLEPGTCCLQVTCAGSMEAARVASWQVK